MANSTKLSKITINRMTKTQFEAGSFPADSINLVDPEFAGGCVLVTDMSGDIVESAIETNTLAYLDGLTGNIQGQLDGLASGAAKAEYISDGTHELRPDLTWNGTYTVDHPGTATTTFDSDGSVIVLEDPYGLSNYYLGDKTTLSWNTCGFWEFTTTSGDYPELYIQYNVGGPGVDSFHFDEISAEIAFTKAHTTTGTTTGKVALVSDVDTAVKEVEKELAEYLPLTGGKLTGDLDLGDPDRFNGSRTLRVLGLTGGDGVAIYGGGGSQTASADPASIVVGGRFGGLVEIDGGETNVHPGRFIVKPTISDRYGRITATGASQVTSPSIVLDDNQLNGVPGAEITIGDLEVRKAIGSISANVATVQNLTIAGHALTGNVDITASDVGAVATDTDGFRIEVATEADVTPLTISPMLAAEAGSSLQYLAIGPSDSVSKLHPDGTDVLTKGVADGLYALRSEIPEGSIVDSEFSTSSKNPVQNAVVTKKFATVGAYVDGKINGLFPKTGGMIAANDTGFISIVPYSVETSAGGTISISGDPHYMLQGGSVHVGGGVYSGGSVRIYAATEDGFSDHTGYHPGKLLVQEEDGTWYDVIEKMGSFRQDLQTTMALSANWVSQQRKINAYPLTSDVTLAAKDVGAVATDNDGLTISVENIAPQAALSSSPDGVVPLRAESGEAKAFVVRGAGGSTRIVPDGSDVVTISTGDGRYVSVDTKVNGVPLTGDVTIAESDPVFSEWKDGTTILAGYGSGVAEWMTSEPVSGIAVGAFSRVGGRYGVAIGYESSAYGSCSVSLGYGARSHGDYTFNINATSLDKVYLGESTLESLVDARVPAAITVDSALDAESENPVQNKAVLTELNTKATVDYVKGAIAEASANYMKAKPLDGESVGFNFGEMKALWEAVAKIVRVLGGTVADFPNFE